MDNILQFIFPKFLSFILNKHYTFAYKCDYHFIISCDILALGLRQRSFSEELKYSVLFSRTIHPVTNNTREGVE